MALTDLTALEPSLVFSRFAEICAIPHGSGHEQALGEYLLAFAAERGLKAVRDNGGNVIIYRPATPGCRYPHPVMVQAHIDMVWTADPSRQFDFASQPIQPIIDGEWIRADKTTLGADNGIGAAYALALLETDEHLPALEAVFTTSEETGMNGALAFDVDNVSARFLLNLDTEDEGVFCVSCSGGIDAEIQLPIASVSSTGKAVSWQRLTVGGLKGGHSGVEIDKGRGNALRLLGRVLDDLIVHCNIDLAEVRGGVVRNAIPAEAWADLAIPAGNKDIAANRVREWSGIFANELHAAGERPSLTLCNSEPRATLMTPGTTRTIVYAMNMIPHGVEAMDFNMRDQRLVETSSNFALIRQDSTAISFCTSIRSSLDSKRAMLVRRMELLAADMGGQLSSGDGYPGWAYDPDSRLRKIFQTAFAECYDGRQAKEEGVHAGLECGVFSRKFLDAGRRLDILSFGPDIRDAHTPEEKASIPSIARVWNLLLKGLEHIAKLEG